MRCRVIASVYVCATIYRLTSLTNIVIGVDLNTQCGGADIAITVMMCVCGFVRVSTIKRKTLIGMT